MNENKFEIEQKNYEKLIKSPENKLKDAFFRIWITKSIISESNWLFSLTKSFLEDWSFNLEKYKDFLDFIIVNRVFNLDEVMWINFKNISDLENDLISYVYKRKSWEIYRY